MWGWARIIFEDEKVCRIAYCTGLKQNLDGIIVYDKIKDTMSIMKFSSSCTEKQSKYFMGVVGVCLMMGKLKTTITEIAN